MVKPQSLHPRPLRNANMDHKNYWNLNPLSLRHWRAHWLSVRTPHLPFIKPSTEFNSTDINLHQDWGHWWSGIRFLCTMLCSLLLVPHLVVFLVVSHGKYVSCKTLILAMVKINTKSRAQEIYFMCDCFEIWQDTTKMYGNKIFSTLLFNTRGSYSIVN